MIWVDFGVLFLLILAFVCCYRLSKNLRSVKDLTNNLAPTIERLSQVLVGVSQSIGILKQTSDISQKGLTTYLPEAKLLNDDLLLLIEHADRLSYRLDELIEKASDVEKDLRQTLLVSMRESEKQNDNKAHAQQLIDDPRNLFVQRVISRYPKDNITSLFKEQESL